MVQYSSQARCTLAWDLDGCISLFVFCSIEGILCFMLFDCGKGNEQKEGGESPKLEAGSKSSGISYHRPPAQHRGSGRSLSPAVSWMLSADGASFLPCALFLFVPLSESYSVYSCSVPSPPSPPGARALLPGGPPGWLWVPQVPPPAGRP